MKNKITLLVFATILIMSSCTSSYKNSQTPDDLYYSPVREVKEEVEKEYDNSKAEEREIRMATRDKRWRDYNYGYDYDYNYDYHYHPYRYAYGYGYYYNPYYYPYPVYYPGVTFSTPKNSTPRTTNLGSYYTNTTRVKDPKTGNVSTIRNSRTYNTTNSGTRRRVISSSDNNSSYNNDTRTYNPSGNSGSRSSGSSGGSAPVNRPSRN